jgi:hypothetical protein
MYEEERSPSMLVGWFVVEIGRRQAWPFLTLANLDTGRELRLYIDSTFAVQPGQARLKQHDDEALIALTAIENQQITAVTTNEGELRLETDDATLILDSVGNDLTSHSPWWIGAGTAT